MTLRILLAVTLLCGPSSCAYVKRFIGDVAVCSAGLIADVTDDLTKDNWRERLSQRTEKFGYDVVHCAVAAALDALSKGITRHTSELYYVNSPQMLNEMTAAHHARLWLDEQERNMLRGQQAYEAYMKHQVGLSPDGRPLPVWEYVSPQNKHAWVAFAEAAKNNIRVSQAYNEYYLLVTKGLAYDGRPAPSYAFFTHNRPEIAAAWLAAWEAARL